MEDKTKGIVGKSSGEEQSKIASDGEGKMVEMFGGKLFLWADYSNPNLMIKGRKLKRLVR